MKEISPLLGAVIALITQDAAMGAPAQVQPFYCPPCPIQTKTPSTKQKGKFEYTIKCTDPESHNSAVLQVTASSDSEAVHIAWRSPRLDEIVVGMELNSYACAEPPRVK